MILTQERTEHRTETECRCGRMASFTIGSRSFSIGARKIALRDVPHFYCSHCDKAIFDSSTEVTELLKYAYQSNLNEINWKDRARFI